MRYSIMSIKSDAEIVRKFLEKYYKWLDENNLTDNIFNYETFLELN